MDHLGSAYYQSSRGMDLMWNNSYGTTSYGMTSCRTTSYRTIF